VDTLFDNLSALQANSPGEAIALVVLAVALAAGAADLVLRLILYRLTKRAQSTESPLGSIVGEIRRPLRLSLHIVAVGAAVVWGAHLLPKDVPGVDIVEKALASALLGTVTWMSKRIADGTRDSIKRKRARHDGGYDDFSALEALHVAALTGIYAVAGLLFLSILGVSPAALAGLGVAGGFGAYALTMANQILISNIFAGLVLYFDRPFGPGDWIITQDGAIEGTVVRIGLRLTVITGFDQRPIYVPNSIFNSTATVNASRMANRRIKQFIGVRYEDLPRLEGIMRDIRTYLQGNDEIDQNRVTLVNLVNGNTMMGSTTEGCFGSSSINLQIYTFTKVTNWVRFQAIQDEVMLRIGNIILEHGAEMAFPTTTVEGLNPLEVTPPPDRRPQGSA